MGANAASSTDVWAAATYATAALPDARLNERLVSVTSVLAAKPLDSIPQAFGSWDQTKATYRFIENERVTIESLRDPVAARTVKECRGKSLVYSIQDTTTLSFATSKTMEGLGPIDSEDSEARGMFLHSTLAVDEDGVALGALDQQYWCRDPEDRGKKYRRKEAPLEDKESVKWLWGIEAARRVIEEQLEAEERPRLIHVFDREGDIHEILQAIVKSPDGAVIRSAQNRRIQPSRQMTLAHDAIRSAPVLTKTVVEVERKKGQAARTAEVELRAEEFTLDPPSSPRKDKSPIALYLVEVWEPSPPKELEALHWLLWTTEEVKNVALAQWVIEAYRKRPKIEEVHLVLKSGCRVESLQFETAERTAKMLALYLPIAIRIVQLRTRARTEPDASCTVVLTEEEWIVLYAAIHKKPPTPRIRPPTLRQAVLWIGRLGGHLNRKRDGMPGVRTLWRGWRDLNMMIPIYRAGRSAK